MRIHYKWPRDIHCYHGFCFLVIVHVCMLSCFSHVWLFAILCTIAHQGFSRQEYWRGLPCPPPGDLSNPEIQVKSSALQADSLLLSHHGSSLVIAIVQSLSCVQLFGPHWLQHTRLPCSSPYPRVCSNSCLLSQWCHSIISFSVIPFSCLHSFPASGSFPVSWLFASGGQSIGASASASVLPMNIQGGFPLGLTGLISLQSKTLSRVFSNTTVGKDGFFSAQHLLVIVCIFKCKEIYSDSVLDSSLGIWISLALLIWVLFKYLCRFATEGKYLPAMVWCSVSSAVSNSRWPHVLHPARFLCPCDSPGKNTGAGCHFLPDPGIQPASLMSLALATWFFTTSATWKALLS